MEPTIVVGKPPNYEAIVARIGRPPVSAIFAYGDTIFVPFEISLPADLVAHEKVHLRQQRDAGGAEIWWERYFDDTEFRLEQEVEAYRVQIAAHPDRASRRTCIRSVVADLAGPMYGRIVSKERARELLAA